MRAFASSRLLWLGCAIVTLAVSGTIRADDDGDRGKAKGKGARPDVGKGDVIQLDVSKLPPELRKQLMKYAEDGRDKAGPQGEAKKGGGSFTLPPGLASKPANHPGRVNWLRTHGYAGPAAGKGQPMGKKGRDKDN